MKRYISLALSVLCVQALANECSTKKDKSEIAKGETCTISSYGSLNVTSNSLTNEGTLIFENSSSLIFKNQTSLNSEIGYQITGNSARGKIKVWGSDASIDASKGNLSITNQDIELANGVKFEIQTKSLTLGAQNQQTTISSKSHAVLALDADALNVVDASLKNIEITSSKLKSISVTNLNLSNFTLNTTSALTLSAQSQTSILSGSQSLGTGLTKLASFTLAGQNYISGTDIKIQEGTYDFKGGGKLIFSGSNSITVGADALQAVSQPVSQGAKVTFTGSNSKEKDKKTSVGFYGSQKDIGVTFHNVEASDITLQIIKDGDGAVLGNIQTTFKDAILEGRDSSGASQVLVIENANSSKSTQGKITITHKQEYGESAPAASKTTFSGAGIKIYGQEISIGENQAQVNKTNKTAYILELKTDENAGEITLGKPNTDSKQEKQPNKDGDVLIEGKNGNGSKQSLQLAANKINFDGSVTLKNLSIQTRSKNDSLVFMGKGETSTLSLEGIDLRAGMLNDKGEGKYQGLIFASEEAGKRSKIETKNDISLKASQFIFKDQNVSIDQGKSLNLYSYGVTNLPKDSKTQGKPEKTGTFAFYDTRFESGANSSGAREKSQGATTLKLYSGENGAKVLSSGLVLKDVNLESLKINDQSTLTNGDAQASLDLSDTASNLTVLGDVQIKAHDFKYQQDGKSAQGVGMDLFVGDKSSAGHLVLQSTQGNGAGKQTGDQAFVLGGVLTLDNSSINTTNKRADGRSTFDIQMGSDKLSEFKITLNVSGGISVLHDNIADQSTEIKAKNFIFDASSKLHSKNGKLILTSSDGVIDAKGLTILEGTEVAKASIEANKQNNTIQNQSTSPMLTLHDVEVRGSAELKSGYKFEKSNISVQSDGTNRTFTIQSTNGAVNNIDSITLKSAVMDVKNSSNGAELKLNGGGSITSSGDSKIQASKISVDSQGKTNSLLTLNVLDGTLTLLEKSRNGGSGGNGSFGAINLGHESKDSAGKITRTGGNLVLLKSEATNQSGQQTHQQNIQPQYNSLTLQGPLTSYGESTLTASSFKVSESVAQDAPLISSIGGELKLIAKDSVTRNTDGLMIHTGEIVLKNGILGYYQTKAVTSAEKSGELELGKLFLGPRIDPRGFHSPIVRSSGNSSIKASEGGLTIRGVDVYSTGGTLRLIGLKDGSIFGDLVLHNGGLSALKGGTKEEEQAIIRLGENKRVRMISSSPFVAPNNPLGGGGFGEIQAKSLIFEDDSTTSQKLIQLEIKPEKLASGEELFSLREGDQSLIRTSEGIIKKAGPYAKEENGSGSKITLSDISIDYGGYKSLKLTPKLIEDEKKDKVLSLVLGVQVQQNSISELIESIQDPDKRKEMEAVLGQGRLEEIADSILHSSDNPFKIGISENIAQGNTKLISEALYYMDDGLSALADLVHTSYKVYDQVASLSFGSLQNRMARVNNPHAAQASIASLIRSASQYRYAAQDDGILLDAVSDAPKGGIWASYDGAMRSGKNVSSSVNGLSAGYDGVIADQALLGGFISYLYGSYNGEHVQNSSHNIHLGLYSRLYYGGNEIDFSLSQMIGMNTATLMMGYGMIPHMLNGEFGFNVYATNFQARYGYAFALGDEESPYYLKPLFGIDTTLLLRDQAQTNAIGAMQVSKGENLRFDLMAGLEFRKYFNPQSYVFVLPMVQAGMLNLGNTIHAGFVGSTALPYEFDTQKDINVGLYAGGQGSVAENLAVSGSMGVKMGVKNTDVITSWNVGLRYKF
ncbi:autotransporter outer membrane beta-barrel domain-containing protein [Helicobacter pametensis]|uniref:autotransporter outer membrane beta-barrel domain-containing protein n=1 Tax=Helicobacter pametensis TaxID=95149 RepID=UPI0012EBD8E2|nr:autotransporter outer membrane beta-barrel domain-containing protein [Helicobacter pametensis]